MDQGASSLRFRIFSSLISSTETVRLLTLKSSSRMLFVTGFDAAVEPVRTGLTTAFLAGGRPSSVSSELLRLGVPDDGVLSDFFEEVRLLLLLLGLADADTLLEDEVGAPLMRERLIWKREMDLG